MSHHVKIVLPCTNEGEWLRLTVDSILEYTHYPSFEIFIIANGDDTTDFSFIEKTAYRKLARLKSVSACLGVGKSINEAVAPGDATYYVFLDAHCLLDQRDWLHRVVSCLGDYPAASMVQPEVINFTYKDTIEPGRALDPSCLEDKTLEYSIRWAWPYENLFDCAFVHTQPQSRQPYEAMAGSGMAVFTRAETFHRLGKHESEVTGWFPKTRDYCLRAWLLGYPMMVDPSVRVYHRRKAGNRGYRFRLFDMVHGILRTTYKYLSPRRRDLAEMLFRKHGLEAEVIKAVEQIHQGSWLQERANSLRCRIHDDDWLFKKFRVYEKQYGTAM